MRNDLLKMELLKVAREIKKHGLQYTVVRSVVDNYGEDTGKTEQVSITQALYHESTGNTRNASISDGTTTHGKTQPKVLVSLEDAEPIQNGDYFLINSNKYKVIEKNNTQEYNILCDITLELVLNGNN